MHFLTPLYYTFTKQQLPIQKLHKLVTRAEVVAVADPSPVAAKWVEENLPGVAYYSTPDSIFSLPNIDAVVISTITSTHASLTIQAIERGIHVLLEKPISVDVEDSRPVVEAARKRKDVKVMIGFVRRCMYSVPSLFLPSFCLTSH